MAVTERTFSEFLQHPNEITPVLARGPVILRRRGAEDLVVMTRTQSTALETAVLAVASAVARGPDAVDTVLPWLAFLGPRDRDECLRDIALATATAMTTGRFDLLRDTLYGWQATGLAAWDEQNRHGKPDYDEEAPVEIQRPSEAA